MRAGDGSDARAVEPQPWTRTLGRAARAAGAGVSARVPGGRAAPLAALALLALPLVGLVLLLGVESVDRRWEHHPSHFWLVLAAAVIPALLGWSIGSAACRRSDARLLLVALAFVSSAAFLGLHALATPGVLLEGSNAGFVVAVPVGLLLASGFAAWSALPLDGSPARWVMARSDPLRWALVAVVVCWGAWSLASLPPLDERDPPESGSLTLVAAAVPAVVLLSIAALRSFQLARTRRSPLLASIAVAWLLLAESMVAVAFARNWHASWWEWHVLLLIAYAAIAESVRRLPESERFSDLYLDDVAGGTREISVLFADLQGFTRYSEAHDPADVQAMLNEYFEAVLPEISARGGRVDRFIGDAVMVTYNVGVEQPDHAERAARSALAFQRAAAAVSEAHPQWPRFRVGLNTGPARVGIIGGGEERGYTVLGDTVNVASRLEAIAPAGAVAIGGPTLRAIPGARVVALGQVAVKGRSEPVEVWQLDSLPGD